MPLDTPEREELTLLWLQSGGCGGCSISLMGAESPDLFTALELARIGVLSHPSLSEAGAASFGDLLSRIRSGEQPLDILCLEGSVLRGPGGTGRFHILAGSETPMAQIIAETARMARYVIAIGSCAAYGGVTAAGDNVTEACGLSFEGREPGGLLGADFRSRAGLPVINISGCPVHPGWVTDTLVQLSLGQFPASDLDEFGRPRFFADHLVHHGCSRNEFYEFKASAEAPGQLGCLMENLGCIGTQVHGDCNIRPWNGEGSCIRGGYPCIGCTEPGFGERDYPYLETPKRGGIPLGLPTDIPKAWFVALAALAKAATPERLRKNALAETITVAPGTGPRKPEEMSRLVVGPFNRVEGDLEIKLDVEDGAVAAAYINSPLYRGFEQILLGKAPADALVYVPRICGICSVSQSMAAASALAMAQGLTPPENGALLQNLILATENVADHLTHFYMFFMPDFAQSAYEREPWYEGAQRFRAMSGPAQRAFIPARAAFLHIMGLVAGHWPHTLGAQPGGTAHAIGRAEQARLTGIVLGMRRFLEATLFGNSLERVAELSSGTALGEWAQASGPKESDFGQFLAFSEALGLEAMGRATGVFLSYGAYAVNGVPAFASGVYSNGTLSKFDPAAITEDHSSSWLVRAGEPSPPARGLTVPDADAPGAYSWCKAPRLAGAVAETGALARQLVDGHPLLRDLAARGGGNVRARVIARLVEVARLILLMERWIWEIRPGDPFCVHAAMPDEAKGEGLIEAARGSLGHWLEIRKGRIFNYQIVAPTTWNFSPRDGAGRPGACEQALVGAAAGTGETAPVAVQHIVRSFDPCMVCTVH